MENHEQRRRIALGLLLIGLLFVAVGIVTLLQARAERRRLQVKPAAVTRPAAAPKVSRLDQLRQLQYYVLAAGGLIGVFLISTLAMARFRRAFMRRWLAKPSAPTQVDDVWSMHKVPELVDEDDDDDEPLVDLPPEEDR